MNFANISNTTKFCSIILGVHFYRCHNCEQAAYYNNCIDVKSAKGLQWQVFEMTQKIIICSMFAFLV